MARQETCTRIGEGDALALDIEQRQLLWVSKTPKITAVHTTAPEGPNNWSEPLTLTPVWEPPYQWRPFADEEYVEACKHKQRTVFEALIDDLETNPMLHKILNAAEEALDVAADVTDHVFEPPLPLGGLPDPAAEPVVQEPHPTPAVSRPRRGPEANQPLREEDLPPQHRTIPLDYNEPVDDPFAEASETTTGQVTPPPADEDDPFATDVADPFDGDDDPFAQR